MVSPLVAASIANCIVEYSLGTKCILCVILNAGILLVASSVIDAPKQMLVSFWTMSTFRMSTTTSSEAVHPLASVTETEYVPLLTA